ncbi:hypothetical protein [Streptococcus merionis]|uniref:hypothetical protein n=1 Tax=Streptococcus merionis TaxID=400065 RepID=UPI0026EEDA93|nr:hypothetical protein [Streptococcus merionis]
MLQKLLVSNQKKDKKSFEKFLCYLLVGVVGLSCVLAILAVTLEVEPFSKGMLVGMCVGFLIISGRIFWILKHPKLLNEEYIKTYDERNQEITRMASSLTLVLATLIIVVLLLLDAFAGIVLDSRLLLTIVLYALFLGFILIKTLLQSIL